MNKLFCLLVLACSSLQAQEIKPAVEKSSLRFTLPGVLKKAGIKKVKTLFTDSRSLTWIGTENGLYRYDGTATVYLRHYNNKAETLPSNNITGIAEDKEGRLWIGTLGGVAELNAYSLQCKRYRQKDGLLKTDFDNKVFVDAGGKIWTGNAGGLELYNAKENRFTQVWINEEWKGKKLSAYVTCLCDWKADSLVLGTFVDLVVVSKKNFGFRRIALPNAPITVMSLAVDPFGKLWCGTWGYGGFVFDKELQHPQNIHWNKSLEGSGILRKLSPVKISNEENMLLAVGNGLVQLPFDKEGKPQFQKAVYFEAPQETESVFSFDAVNSSTMLVAGSGGMANFSLLSDRFTKLPIPAKGSLQEPSEFTLNNNHYLVQPTWHSGQGVFLVNEEAGSYKQFTRLPFESNEGTNVSSFLPDNRGRFWCASFGGVTVLDTRGELLYDFSKAKGADTLTRRKTNGLFIRNDTVWVLCYKAGVDLYNLDFKKLGHLQVNGPPLAEGPVWKIFGDAKNRVWLCGNDALWQYFPGQKQFQQIDLSEEKTGCMVNDIAEGKNGHLFVATQQGLADYNPENGRHRFLRSPLLQKEDEVYSVTCDAANRLWFITANHLVCYDPATNHFTLYDDKDGIQTKSELQWVKSFDGHCFYLSQSNGVYRFYPDQWTSSGEPPKLVLHQLQIADSNWVYSQPPSTLSLDYNQNRIYVEYDGINYENPEQNTYASRLQPLEKEWTFSNRNFVQYSNLSPGDYVLRLKVSNNAGRWSDDFVLNVRIAPPFWLTWWFLLGTALIFVGLLILMVRYISQRNLREKILRLEKQTAIEKERNRIAQDMHDDLGSGLTKIAILSEVAKTQLTGNEAAVTPLEKISTSSRELVDNLQDIIWVLNPRNDSLENTVAYLREYAVKFFESTQTDVRFHFPETIPSHKLSEEQRRNLFLVMKETLNNVAKHAAATVVEINMQLKNDSLQFVVCDNGKGFETRNVRQWSNGLQNMRQRMEQIGGSYCIKSEEGGGTTTMIVLPL
ncbi:sensor histidine kinase [Flavisolibacter ginsenosidimutans]|uniref:histidine kinase n=1 Tax=Flavisolibacter ginsenosidimutans TaxID=661481 RepID=A0A5B8UFA9_9BACT|nr:two-component regulator propeller domain-containing protein [Flavisolibacter ginsenosidimutans]QEC54819.1 hypothetical protein FSB75_02510 [Flavisolibacter ginsenosidimutans]